MSYKVPVPNVFLSFNNKINQKLNRLEGNGLNETTTNFGAMAKEDGVFLITGNHAMQVLSFEHNIVGGSHPGVASMRIIDPLHELENKILGATDFTLLPEILKDRLEVAEKVDPVSKTNDLLTRIGQASNKLSVIQDLHADSRVFKNSTGITCNPRS